MGYIVGLGDRHIQNILIDEQSAELVHIDLGTTLRRRNFALPQQSSPTSKPLSVFSSARAGVAFEQGKILPTPETVPFRLSRDIVDGMGITGVEGVFRR